MPIGYMPHLDGLRAFAVGGVIVEHWASGMPRPVRTVVDSLDLGGWGVECFFVLSGFLITLLLLQAKAGGQAFGTALGHFYSRRVLRIFPAYYLVLGLCLIFLPTTRDYLSWHFFYLGNIYLLWHDSFVPVGGHFWSLALEEQFYLFWPLIVLLVPSSRLAYVALVLCALAPITRLVLWYAMGEAHLSIWTFPTTALDLLGFGAFLAITKDRRQLSTADPFVRQMQLLGLGALVVYALAYKLGHDTVEFAIVGRSLIAMVFGALVLHASFGFTGAVRHLLGNRLVVWLGTISYGLYIYHQFVPGLYLRALQTLDLPVDSWGLYYVRYPLLLMLLLVVTSASFYLWEQPIRRYRKNFQ